jgi:hypothetical protein
MRMALKILALLKKGTVEKRKRMRKVSIWMMRKVAIWDTMRRLMGLPPQEEES